MSHLHPIFTMALRPFAPPPENADDREEQSMLADDREDIGYEMARQRRIDNEPEESTC